ncbi:MAG: NUDIX domain-containing protein [Coraliomargaritaceae bacterium]
MRTIRTAARALIIKNKKVLTIKMRDKTGIFYILPGGGQEHGETLEEGLQRECLEELGAHVKVGKLLYLREYIGKNHEFRDTHSNFHQVESVFSCELSDPEAVGRGTNHDKKQIGIEWIPLVEMPQRRFLPQAIKSAFNEFGFQPQAHYLGDIN